MPAYKLKDAVERTAVEREVELLGSHKDLLWKIEKALKNRDITTEEAIDMLKENKDFRLHFKEDDFIKIKREIE